MKGICHDITPILGRSADYREKRSHSCMINSHRSWNILPQNIFNTTNEGKISIKCWRFTYSISTLNCWCEEKKTSIPFVQVVKQVVTCSTEVEACGLTPKFTMKTPNSSSGLPDKIIFQFIVYYSETPRQP